MGYFTDNAKNQTGTQVIPAGNYRAKVVSARTYEKEGSIRGIFLDLDVIAGNGVVKVNIALWVKNYVHAEVIEDALQFCSVDLSAMSGPDVALEYLVRLLPGCVIQAEISTNEYKGKTRNQLDSAQWIDRGNSTPKQAPQQQAPQQQAPVPENKQRQDDLPF